ncbi:MAG: hypothetical protein ABIT83_13905, partial [Massilia sp.]
AATAAGMGQAAASDRPPPGRRPSLSVAEAAMARSSANTAAIRAKRERSFLRRGDIVRDDQPDLAQAMRNGCGYGPHGAGRAGPRDRRMPAFEALAWNRR